MTEYLELKVGGQKSTQHEWGHWDLELGSQLSGISFFEYQLVRKGINLEIASTIQEMYPNCETLGDLLEVLE